MCNKGFLVSNAGCFVLVIVLREKNLVVTLGLPRGVNSSANSLSVQFFFFA